MIVRCSTCHREERWSEGEVDVLLEGGQRQPRGHPTLAAWNSLDAARTDGLAPVGRCVCGQPLLGEPDAAIPYPLTFDDTQVTVQPGWTVDGPFSDWQALGAALTARHGPGLLDDIDPVQTTMQLVLMTPLTLVFVLWLITAVTVGLFLFSFAQRPGFG